MIKELEEILEQAYEDGIITSMVHTKVEAIKRSLKLTEEEYLKIDDRIRIAVYVKKLTERKRKGITFFGDLVKQYRISAEEKVVIAEQLKTVVEPKKTEVKKKEPSKNQSKGMVLVADDNENQLLLIKQMLAKNNYECITAETPETAIQSALEKKPNLILCDVNFGIGKMTGFDVYKELKSRKSAPAFIIVSAYFQKEFSTMASNAGIKDYLTKPLEEEKLLSTLSKYLPTNTA